MTDADREREREAQELRDVTARVDPSQGFEVEQPTAEQLGPDEVLLWQQPSEADVLAEEAELDRRRQAEEPDEDEDEGR
jgi:hypothetical protein